MVSGVAEGLRGKGFGKGTQTDPVSVSDPNVAVTRAGAQTDPPPATESTEAQTGITGPVEDALDARARRLLERNPLTNVQETQTEPGDPTPPVATEAIQTNPDVVIVGTQTTPVQRQSMSGEEFFESREDGSDFSTPGRVSDAGGDHTRLPEHIQERTGVHDIATPSPTPRGLDAGASVPGPHSTVQSSAEAYDSLEEDLAEVMEEEEARRQSVSQQLAQALPPSRLDYKANTRLDYKSNRKCGR